MEIDVEPVLEIEELEKQIEEKSKKERKKTPREQQMNRPFFNSNYEKYDWLISNGSFAEFDTIGFCFLNNRQFFLFVSLADKGNTFGTVKCSSGGACKFLKNVPEKIDAIHKRLDKVMIENRDFASSISTQYDENSAVIGSNLDYAAIHQLRSQAGKNKKVEIPARPYLKLTDNDFNEILDATEHYLK